jgi:hypothetical protein
MVEHCRGEEYLRAEQTFSRQLNGPSVLSISSIKVAWLAPIRQACRAQSAVNRMRTQRPLPVNPAAGRRLVMQVHGGTKKPFAAYLTRVSALGKVAVRLPRTRPFTQGKTDPGTAHGRDHLNTAFS